MFESIKYKQGETFYNTEQSTLIFNWRNGYCYHYQRDNFCFTQLLSKEMFVKLFFL